MTPSVALRDAVRAGFVMLQAEAEGHLAPIQRWAEIYGRIAAGVRAVTEATDGETATRIYETTARAWWSTRKRCPDCGSPVACARWLTA
jgi:hypothetical protein